MQYNRIKIWSFVILLISLFLLFLSTVYYFTSKNKYSLEICDVKLCEHISNTSIEIIYYLQIEKFEFQSVSFIHNTTINYHCNSTIPCYFNNYQHGISLDISDNEIFFTTTSFVIMQISICVSIIAFIVLVLQIIYDKYFMIEYDLHEDAYVLKNIKTTN